LSSQAMRRDLNRLANESFHLLVIGGGIVGAAIARDASLRGLSVALVERGDFANATSARNSRLIHGGLRYLRNFELSLVRESLRERQIWLRIAPHLVRPLPFLFPLTRTRRGRRAVLGAGLSLYDFLSLAGNASVNSDQRLPAHTWLDARAAGALEPCLRALPLAGAFRYFDAQMDSPERLALECVLDTAENGAVAANHVEADSLLLRSGRVEGARMRDKETGSSFDVRAQVTVLALGAWSDVFLAQALDRPAHNMRLSKGIHVLVRPLTGTHALTIASSRSHFFVLPWRRGTLLGTTDTPFAGDPDSVAATPADIEAFLGLVNAHLPGVQLRPADVRHSYAGLRALTRRGAQTTYDTSRRAERIDHARRDGVAGLLSVIGGKWTTSRHLAQQTVDAVLERLDRRAGDCSTASRPLPGGAIDSLSSFLRESQGLAGRFPNPEMLARLYGARLSRLLALAAARPELSETLSADGTIAAQIVLAVREEMAVTLEDVVMRRTGIGQEGDPGAAVLEKAAAIMAREAQWNEARRHAETEAVAAVFRGSPA
jgi:glycerol-3-phosphate dehydrogenase